MLSPEYLQKIGGDHDEQIYASGEQIIRQGDPGASMFFIIDGLKSSCSILNIAVIKKRFFMAKWIIINS